MIGLKLSLVLFCATAITAAAAVARSRPCAVPEPYPAASYAYNPANDPNVFTGGTFAGSDPEIRVGLAREFGRGGY